MKDTTRETTDCNASFKLISRTMKRLIFCTRRSCFSVSASWASSSLVRDTGFIMPDRVGGTTPFPKRGQAIRSRAAEQWAWSSAAHWEHTSAAGILLFGDSHRQPSTVQISNRAATVMERGHKSHRAATRGSGPTPDLRQEPLLLSSRTQRDLYFDSHDCRSEQGPEPSRLTKRPSGSRLKRSAATAAGVTWKVVAGSGIRGLKQASPRSPSGARRINDVRSGAREAGTAPPASPPGARRRAGSGGRCAARAGRR